MSHLLKITLFVLWAYLGISFFPVHILVRKVDYIPGRTLLHSSSVCRYGGQLHPLHHICGTALLDFYSIGKMTILPGRTLLIFYSIGKEVDFIPCTSFIAGPYLYSVGR